MIIFVKALDKSAVNSKIGGAQPWVAPKAHAFKCYLADKAYGKLPNVFVHGEVGGLQDLILNTYLGEKSEYSLQDWTSDVALDITQLKLRPPEPVIIVIADRVGLYSLMISLNYGHDGVNNLGQIKQGGFIVREAAPSIERPGGTWHFYG